MRLEKFYFKAYNFFMIEDAIFKKARLDLNKIKSAGLKKFSSGWELEKAFMDGAFRCVIWIYEKGNVKGKVYDFVNGEEYLPLRMEHQTGGFSSKVRLEYEKMLEDILKNYFIEKHFTSLQANRITDLIYKYFNVKPDFPWKDQKTGADAGVFRKNVKGKWFALIMNIKKDRLILNAKENADIINLKLESDEIETLIKKEGFYPAYHMNKKYWITLILDETLSDETIIEYIKKSY